jgi:hypothetical protein
LREIRKILRKTRKILNLLQSHNEQVHRKTSLRQMSCLSPSQASINFIPTEYYKVGSQTARTILRHSQGAIDRVPPDQQPVSISTAAPIDRKRRRIK